MSGRLKGKNEHRTSKVGLKFDKAAEDFKGKESVHKKVISYKALID